MIVEYIYVQQNNCLYICCSTEHLLFKGRIYCFTTTTATTTNNIWYSIYCFNNICWLQLDPAPSGNGRPSPPIGWHRQTRASTIVCIASIISCTSHTEKRIPNTVSSVLLIAWRNSIRRCSCFATLSSLAASVANQKLKLIYNRNKTYARLSVVCETWVRSDKFVLCTDSSACDKFDAHDRQKRELSFVVVEASVEVAVAAVAEASVNKKFWVGRCLLGWGLGYLNFWLSSRT